ncbi:ParB-like protein [Cupriavidus sp. WKF15]|uniref:ParB-like protein n=1 Tax=Cupriavidus sp. WKF15 TaxID=3032282 RepID=UPI0023E1C024|nr:ParB-like protein [Cupriavidus sp. WKF15]WER48651.1 ParB-like protein [Cupriavidus sp. WKF15]
MREPRLLRSGAKLMMPLDALHPTQITVGAYHVAQKVHVTRRIPPARRPAFLDRHRVHLVIGPEQVPYVVDHHHWVRAWHELGLTHVPALVRRDLSRLGARAFWKWMVAQHMVHPYDEQGRRRPLNELPASLHDMRDDPYRSLEAFVQLAGGYRKVRQAYPDFRWADFFRRHIEGPLDTPESFAAALVRAFRLAQGAKARNLPGYIGRLSC